MGAENEARAPRARLSVVPDHGTTPEYGQLPITRFGGGGFRGELLARGLRGTVKPFISFWSRVPLLPWPYFLVDYVGLALRPVAGTTFERIRLTETHAEIVRTPATEDRVIVYLHGGAFVVGGRFLHRQLISRIADRTRATVYSVEYRQLPKHPVSSSVADALDAYRHVLASGVPASKVMVMGDSAGGYLAFQLALEAEREGLPMPAGIVAMSPLIDFDGTVKLAAPSAATCALFPANCFDGLGKVVLRAALRAGEAVSLPEAPSRGELARLPRTLIQASSAEMVYPDAESMTEALARAGVDVELQVWDHQVHVFQAAAGLIPEADQALDEIAVFADEVVPDAVWAVEA